jgi:hypothetical protein
VPRQAVLAPVVETGKLEQLAPHALEVLHGLGRLGAKDIRLWIP